MSLIPEIEMIQNTIKNVVLKELDINTTDELNAFIEKSDFKDFFKKFDCPGWPDKFYVTLKKELKNFVENDPEKENADLSETLKTLFIERFFHK